MYTPIQPGIPRSMKTHVAYKESAANSAHVLCFWTLFTPKKLQKDFEYLVLPDGCVDIIFDLSLQPEFDGALIMTPSTSAERLSLGKHFAYAGIRLRPGAWLHSLDEIVGGASIKDTVGEFDLREARAQLAKLSPTHQITQLKTIANALASARVIGSSLLTRTAQDPATKVVEEIVQATGYSRRHVQRLFQQNIGFSPHDFIKITRFQRSIKDSSHAQYADQSHYIRECKRTTGMTPSTFAASYL